MNPLVPTPDESYERFIIRAHQLLTPSVPDPAERNQIIWDAWSQFRGPTEEQRIAERTFAPDRYKPNHGVCVFAEHSAVDAKGQPRTYGLKEMVRICRAGNHRILDVDGFSPISDGHTPNPEDPIQTEPDILGYAGPYRLGMIGRKEPKWAIFADEWHNNETAERLARKPRRSVELWTFAKDPTKAHFDPIAAIGSETPRLNLPVKFRRQVRDGVLVERYTFALPGSGSTFTKKFAQNEEVSPMPNNEELVSQILAAIAETPQFQFLDQLMQQEQGGAAGAEDIPTDAGEAPIDGDGTEGMDDAGPPPDEGLAPDAGGDDDLSDLDDLIVPEDEEPTEKNMLPGLPGMGGNRQYSRNGNGELATKYSRLQQAHNALVQEHGRMASTVRGLHHAKADAERAAVIHKLESEFGDQLVDSGELLEQTLYSRGANMDDDTFRSHIGTVHKYAHRARQAMLESAGDIPQGEVDRGKPADEESEKYQAALAQEAVRIHTEAVNAGEDGYTYAQAKEKARERLAAAK